MLTNKTANECWNILKYEIESIIDKFIPFYAYVRSKQNVRDKVGPLDDSAGNIISQGFNGRRPKWLLQFSVYQRGY